MKYIGTCIRNVKGKSIPKLVIVLTNYLTWKELLLNAIKKIPKMFYAAVLSRINIDSLSSLKMVKNIATRKLKDNVE